VKPQPNKVDGKLALDALSESKRRTEIWTHYIIAHYRATGNLAPGCDAKDLSAWIEGEPGLPDWCKSKVKVRL
jgi:hypothetical protein